VDAAAEVIFIADTGQSGEVKVLEDEWRPAG
jgi:hypothetical protein